MISLAGQTIYIHKHGLVILQKKFYSSNMFKKDFDSNLMKISRFELSFLHIFQILPIEGGSWPERSSDCSPCFLRAGYGCLLKKGREYIPVKISCGVYAGSKCVTAKCDLQVSGLIQNDGMGVCFLERDVTAVVKEMMNCILKNSCPFF